jgi:hypothetical protein
MPTFPPRRSPTSLALVSFISGIEVGQLLFVGTLLLAGMAFRGRALPRLASPAGLPAYGIGAPPFLNGGTRFYGIVRPQMGPRVLLLLALFATGLSASPPLVRKPTRLPKYGNEYPLEVYTGNFGGDSATDVLTVVAGHSIQVLVNGAGGILGEPRMSTITETGIVDAATGDLDGDGDLDVVFTVHDAQQIVTYLNDGSGQFTRGAVIANQRAGEVAIGDFNGDGHQDIALLRSEPSTFSGTALLFPGSGAASFGAPVTTELTLPPGKARVVDANHDGRADLLGFASHGYLIALGQANGTFAVSLFANAVTPQGDLATGDFNHDGNVDFVAIGDSSLQYGVARVFLGTGNGTFTEAGQHYGWSISAWPSRTSTPTGAPTSSAVPTPATSPCSWAMATDPSPRRNSGTRATCGTSSQAISIATRIRTWSCSEATRATTSNCWPVPEAAHSIPTARGYRTFPRHMTTTTTGTRSRRRRRT